MLDILLIIKAVIIGIVEGITEFLPVSSTGHMIIVGNFINFKPPFVAKDYADMFEVVIQLGAILAIVVLYWNKILDSLRNFRGYGLKLWTNIIIAFIPSAAVGLILNDWIKANLFNPLTVVFALIAGGFLMIFMENRYRKTSTVKRIEDVGVMQSVKIGLFQCLALWPGMSRSASTIMGGWFSGLSNVAAAEFSFFLALPTMVAASGLDLIKGIKDSNIVFNSSAIIALAVGFIISFVVALIVVDKFIGFLKKKPMRIFAIYRIIIGIVLLLLAVTNLVKLSM